MRRLAFRPLENLSLALAAAFIVPAVLVTVVTLLALPVQPAVAAEEAPLLDGLGDLHHPVSTDVALAQRYFDQGLTLAWGFNHAEAERSFRQAARLDPGCAMCWWGVALVLGPNINAGMEDDAVPEAWAALERAWARTDGATERERAYIAALSERYVEEPVADRGDLDRAYADALREVVREFPDDLDAATLLAEALMVTTPWDYWREDGSPRSVTREILTTLESVLERDPEHIGANHLYIHAVEAVHPERGVAAAERLGDLAPGAGHLVHMPSHIYLQVGRYHEAARANQRAIEADREYLAGEPADGLYQVAYVPHNFHFLWAAATMEGREELALDAANRLADHVDAEMMREPGYGTLQHYKVIPLYALVRFGEWERILQRPAPPEELLYPRGVWHYARGMARIRQGELELAEREFAALRHLAGHPKLAEVTIWDINTTRDLLRIAVAALAGELAAERGSYDTAVRRLRLAVAREDELNYDEPPPWHYPMRQSLGAVLLEAGRPAQAEEVYREDLERYPRNGWSLYGLHRSLQEQGEEEKAAAVAKRFETAWRHADVELTASRF